MKRVNALFIYTSLSTFVKGDIEILSEKYNITSYKVDNSTGTRLALSLFKLFIYLLFKTSRFGLIYIWFADYHSFLPILAAKLFGKKSCIVAGGYDIVRERRYRYGSFINPLRGAMALYSLNNATYCLAVSENVKRVINAIAKRANCSVVYNGVYLEESNSERIRSEKSGVLCVSLISSEQSFYIKGADRFISAAEAMPDVKFTLIGVEKRLLEKYYGILPANLEVPGKAGHNLLAGYYAASKVYCQFSRRESFCLALAEAMLYNCIPVIANTGGMPEVTGDKGIIINEFPPEKLVEAIMKALGKESSGYAEIIRQRFHIDIRKQKLLRLFENN
jgi:glycosyltransferase involved in cell wall biosynthesis